MTNNVAIDVFIGIVFVFLLYSLYATIIMEIIATFLGLRARTLSYAVKRMLLDEKEIKYIGRCLRKTGTLLINFSGRSFNLKSSELFKKFYNQPSIKYLSSGSIFNKPSYLNPQNFSKALIDSLKDDSDKPGPLEKIKDSISKLTDGDTKKHLMSLLEDANNDLLKFQLLIDNWFENTMERVIGWYKRKTQFILLIIGLGIAIIFNANTFQIINKLSKDDKAREQLVTLATTYIKENPKVIQTIDSIKNDSSEIAVKLDTLLKIREDILEDIAVANSVVNIDWPRMDSIKINQVESNFNKSDIKKLQKAAFIINNDPDIKYVNYPQGVDKIIFKEALKTHECLGHNYYSKNKTGDYIYFKKNKYLWEMILKNIWGYIVTALAISLGAPFWFDLLNKLIKLRTSVVQKDTAKPVSETGAGSNPNSLVSPLDRKG